MKNIALTSAFFAVILAVRGGESPVPNHPAAAGGSIGLAHPGTAPKHLPDWIRQQYGRGLMVALDDDGNVTRFTASRVMNDSMLGDLAELPRLRELHVEVTRGITPAGLAQLARLQALEKLSLYKVNAEGEALGDEAIRSVLELPALRDLSISECGTTDAGARQLERLPRLVSLNLYQEARLTDDALLSIGRLSGLKSLLLGSYVGTTRLGRMRFSAAGIAHLKGLTNLESLSLVGHEVSAGLLNFPRLKSLSLGHPAVDDLVAADIGALRELRELELSYCGVGDAGMRTLATLPELRRLDLSSRLVTDEGIKPLQSHPRLESVSLRASGVSDASLRVLATVSNLTWLTLYGSGEPGVSPGSRFTLGGLLALGSLPQLNTLQLNNLRLPPGEFSGLKELARVRTLSLFMCNLDDAELEALQSAMPDTQVMGSGGRYGRPTRGISESASATNATSRSQ